MSTRDDAIFLVANKLHDRGSGAPRSADVQLTDAEIGEEVDAAVTEYSRDRPRVIVTRVEGTGGSYYSTAGLAGWVNDWSRPVLVEHPIMVLGATETSRQTVIDPERVTIVRDATAQYVYLEGYAPTSTEDFLIAYTAPHTLGLATDTIPPPHFDAVCSLAASRCCTRMAAKASASSDPTIAADGVAYRDAQLRWRQTGEDFFAQYRRAVGLPESGLAGATAFGNWDVRDSWGRPRLTHWYGWR
jgi:hypothetical protein